MHCPWRSSLDCISRAGLKEISERLSSVKWFAFYFLEHNSIIYSRCFNWIILLFNYSNIKYRIYLYLWIFFYTFKATLIYSYSYSLTQGNPAHVILGSLQKEVNKFFYSPPSSHIYIDQHKIKLKIRALTDPVDPRQREEFSATCCRREMTLALAPGLHYLNCE